MTKGFASIDLERQVLRGKQLTIFGSSVMLASMPKDDTGAVAPAKTSESTRGKRVPSSLLLAGALEDILVFLMGCGGNGLGVGSEEALEALNNDVRAALELVWKRGG